MIFRILLVLLLAVAPALAQVPMTGAGKATPGAAVVPLSLDGSVEANGSGSTITASLTTTQTNNVIVVFLLTNANDIGTTVSGATLGAFTKRATSTSGSGPIQLWYAIASGVLTGEVITVTPSSANFTTVIAFAVHGAKTAAPFDVNGSLPATSGASPSDPLSVSTSAANTMILGGFRSSIASQTAGAGYTAIQLNGDYMLAEYKIVSATQSGLSVTIGTGAGASNGGIADAIVQGP